jgi:hypothetical protein
MALIRVDKEINEKQIKREKMQPWDVFELITRYNYLNTTDCNVFYFTLTKSKNRYYTEKIFLTEEEAKMSQPDLDLIVEKELNVKLVFPLVKMLSYHPKLVFYGYLAASMIYNIPGLQIYKMLEGIIPKEKYWIKGIKKEKIKEEEVELIQENLEINDNDMDALFSVLECDGTKNEFLKIFKLKEGKK